MSFRRGSGLSGGGPAKSFLRPDPRRTSALVDEWGRVSSGFADRICRSADPISTAVAGMFACDEPPPAWWHERPWF